MKSSGVRIRTPDRDSGSGPWRRSAFSKCSCFKCDFWLKYRLKPDITIAAIQVVLTFCRKVPSGYDPTYPARSCLSQFASPNTKLFVTHHEDVFRKLSYRISNNCNLSRTKLLQNSWLYILRYIHSVLLCIPRLKKSYNSQITSISMAQCSKLWSEEQFTHYIHSFINMLQTR